MSFSSLVIGKNEVIGIKLIHISDLHIGKRVNGFSLMNEQKDILSQILNIVKDNEPDGVLIAGDVYDRSVPSAEAVQLLDEFLFSLSNTGVQVMLISGNHDSAERLAFGGRLMEHRGIHISPVYDGRVKKLSLRDAWGEADIYMLPFLKPANVRRFFPEEEIDSYSDALRTAIAHMDVDKQRRNILLTHQFVTGAERCDSEEISVGGTDNVDASIFDDFDYVALGHIHGPQSVSRKTIRYCGSPLKYSFSEAKHSKSVTLVELKEKGDVNISTIPLIPMRDMVEIKGSYAQLSDKSFYTNLDTDHYYHISLTDEEDVPDALSELRRIYPYLMRLDYDNSRTRSRSHIEALQEAEQLSPMELFSQLYETQNGKPMSSEQQELMLQLMEKIWEVD